MIDSTVQSQQDIVKVMIPHTNKISLRKNWYCTSDENAEERASQMKKAYMLELEKWIYGIRRILERNQIPPVRFKIKKKFEKIWYHIICALSMISSVVIIVKNYVQN